MNFGSKSSFRVFLDNFYPVDWETSRPRNFANYENLIKYVPYMTMKTIRWNLDFEV